MSNSLPTLRRWLTAKRCFWTLTSVSGVLAFDSSALAQSGPAARLLPAVPAPAEPEKPVVRAASPDLYSVPAQAGSAFAPGNRPRPAVAAMPQQPAMTESPDSGSWVRNTVSSVRDAMFGKPQPHEQWVPTPNDLGTSQNFVPYGRTFAGGQMAPAAAPQQASAAMPSNGGIAYPTPQPQPVGGREFVPHGMTFAGGQAPSGAVTQASATGAASVPQGVYAGPPAYRWYGWGTTTPGANPYSPNGQYPKASANWYAQTGATPGAFPIPVTASPHQLNGAEPPAYASTPQVQPGPDSLPAFASRVQLEPPPPPQPMPIPVPPQTSSPPKRLERTERPERTESQPEPPKPTLGSPVVSIRPQPTFEPPTQPPLPPTPTIPSGPAMPVGTPIASSAGAPPALQQPVAPSPQPIAVGQGSGSKSTELSWQTVPAAPATTPPAPPSGIVQTQYQQPAAPERTNEANPQWNQVGAAPRADVRPAPEEAAIRQICGSRVTTLKVVTRGPNKITVAFTANNEATARRIAADIAQLPELHMHEVSFEASVTSR